MTEIDILQKRIDTMSKAIHRLDEVIKAQAEVIIELERSNAHAWELIAKQRQRTEQQLVQTKTMINEFTANACEFFKRNGMKETAKDFKKAVYGEHT